MTWTPELEQVGLMRELGKRMGGEAGIARQHAQGRLTVRERLDLLVDPNSFQEIGTTSGVSTYDEEGQLVSFRPGSSVRGFGQIDGRPVMVQGGDFTIRGGAADGAVRAPSTDINGLAGALRIPFIRLLDGSGGSVRNYD
ncbi:MAG TPA: carboxyl transferase domain-containing protein, partial [Dehalococcoidia bacterium]